MRYLCSMLQNGRVSSHALHSWSKFMLLGRCREVIIRVWLMFMVKVTVVFMVLVLECQQMIKIPENKEFEEKVFGLD